MISKFFIDRPVFSAVLSIVIVLAGLVSIRALPIEQYPSIVPPEVIVSATYPGADARTIAETVAAPLEQQINGVEGMIYMRSTATGTGTMRISVSFEIGTDPDQATINVNNRVQRATVLLPEEVRRQGVTVAKRSSSILQVVTMSSPGGRYDTIFISNYALVNVIDELRRTAGVGDASLFGASDYSMRIWLRPDKVAQYKLTPSDVAAAIREQNSQFAAGRFGEEPMRGDQAFTYSVTTQGRFADPKEFENIIVRSDPSGAALRVKDVARVELGSQNYSTVATLNGAPAVPIGVYLQPGANALEVATAVQETMDRLSRRFPEGLRYDVPFNTTRFIQASVEEVAKTFAEAIALVVLVVFVFLQTWRATLIPVLAVPVSIVGTFAGMYLLGFSINLFTLFGLILAIGIVVDDAIVVLENVERNMAGGTISAYDAAVQAMREVTGPIVATTLVLAAVFVPVSFLGGLAGELYRQFAVTIAVSVIISSIVALTLTPALCALLLKSGHREPWLPFRWFNRGFSALTSRYTAGVRFFLRHAVLAIALIAVMLGATWLLFQRVPGALVPSEDQGYVFLVTQLPPAASLDRTLAVTEKVSAGVVAHPAVADVVTLAGFDFLAGAQKTNSGVSFVSLKDWSERTDPALDARALPRAFAALNARFLDGVVIGFNPPPIQGISTTGGIEFYLQDRSGGSLESLNEAVQRLVAAAGRRPELTGVSTTFSTGTPQYRVIVDREKAKALGVPIASLFDTMQSSFGSLYVNDFTLFGRTFRVTLSSEGAFRETPDDLRHVFVRSQEGAMVPLSALVTVSRTVGPDVVERFNVFPAARVQASPAAGFSSGQAIAAIQQVVAETLSADYTIGWTGAAYQEIQTAGSGAQGFLFGILMVFLVLAAQYERWSLPLAVVAAVPFAVFGAILAIWLRGIENDVYFQVGLVTLIGLAAKNAILIVAFAADRQEAGRSATRAAIEAARLRFRPVVMTSLALVLGVLPLAIASGAGSASRHSVGTGVIGGMLAATFLAILFVPLFFRLVLRTKARPASQAEPDPVSAAGEPTRPPAAR
ncbi:multidrug efflux RND transporter permease subunit [Rhodoplanes sp. TEM]|uniref:Efflux pump membrane transporter n=1 Tax=Rhodoplanes tepidamans TaxID=200616 RepID=A0ABT5J503_RHOTP|nr:MULTISPECIES: multidrug efflux RND transporter permease subunit [Rhodoplanes]MDC7784723.1 multidrug efflux RND transporter permease subunit [Rhodoplanes tepidamans]MDC7982190.1 multidrug efflux RND transporter permease subunit [Rhodoplanes sp. TEM]MDQ0356194.1 multidrug efflux pump [Rhodoplanes tepidamans]